MGCSPHKLQKTGSGSSSFSSSSSKPEKSDYENEDDDEDEISRNVSHRKDRQARGYRAQSWHGD
jgi:hypothetical protein